MSSTRDIEIITFQILSYEMPITVKQYFVTEQCTRSSIILQKPSGWWREMRSSRGGEGWGNEKWGKTVGFPDTRLWDKGGGLGQRSSFLGFNNVCQIREERQFALTMGRTGGHG